MTPTSSPYTDRLRAELDEQVLPPGPLRDLVLLTAGRLIHEAYLAGHQAGLLDGPQHGDEAYEWAVQVTPGDRADVAYHHVGPNRAYAERLIASWRAAREAGDPWGMSRTLRLARLRLCGGDWEVVPDAG